MTDNKPRKIDEKFLREAARKYMEMAKAGTLHKETALRHGVIPVTLKKIEAAEREMEIGEEN